MTVHLFPGGQCAVHGCRSDQVRGRCQSDAWSPLGWCSGSGDRPQRSSAVRGGSRNVVALGSHGPGRVLHKSLASYLMQSRWAIRMSVLEISCGTRHRETFAVSGYPTFSESLYRIPIPFKQIAVSVSLFHFELLMHSCFHKHVRELLTIFGPFVSFNSFSHVAARNHQAPEAFLVVCFP